MARKKKGSLFSIRKPRLTVGKKGVRVTAPSARIGKKTGVNISKRGVSFSKRTRMGTLNSKKGCSQQLGMLLFLPVLVVLAARFLGAAASHRAG